MSAHDDWVRFISVPVAVLSAAGGAYAAQYLSVEQAQSLMFGQSARFERNDLKLTKDIAREIQKASGVRVRLLEQPLWEVRENSTLVGYFIVDEVYGKHEFITYAVGLEADGRVRQVETLDYRETYGYQVRNAEWRTQFVGKTSASELRLDADIRNISGATLSCRHLAEGVKRLLATYDRVLRKN
jgi:Na+-translocating ferredoxin:NAD+ oxidoreductase RnfG subunit